MITTKIVIIIVIMIMIMIARGNSSDRNSGFRGTRDAEDPQPLDAAGPRSRCTVHTGP